MTGQLVPGANAQEEGINRAAEVLHVTQPALSRQLSRLEEEVGVKLFHRGARKITLTNEGMLLRRRAEEIPALVDRTEKDLEDLSVILPRRQNVRNEVVSWFGDSYQKCNVLFTSNLSSKFIM